MMDTVLNLGLNEATLHGLIALTGNERFGWDAYRRFIQMFGRIVMEVPGEQFDARARRRQGGPRREAGHRPRRRGAAGGGRRVHARSSARSPAATSRATRWSSWTWPIKAVFASWYGKRAHDYREYNKIAHDLGTAVNVVTMVFGNMGDDSGTGVAFTRDPNTGEKVLYGEYLTNAQGEDVVAGIRTPRKISQMREQMPEVYAEFQAIAERLERHYRDVQDLEFTIERGHLYMLQTRSAKRTAAAAVKIAVDMVGEGIIDRKEAVARIEPAYVDQLLRDQFDPDRQGQGQAPGHGPQRLARGGRGPRRLRRGPAPSSGPGPATRSSSSASRRHRTTSTAWPPARASSPPAAGPRPTRPSWRARSASPAWPAAPRSWSTTRHAPPPPTG